MRNPDRIGRIMTKLHKAWQLVPDWRLGQLISNLRGAGPQDVFHPEDEEWEALLDEFIAKRDGQKA